MNFFVCEAHCSFSGTYGTAVRIADDVVVCHACLLMLCGTYADERGPVPQLPGEPLSITFARGASSRPLFSEAWLGEVTRQLYRFYDPATGRLLRAAPEFDGADDDYRCSACTTHRSQAARMAGGGDAFVCDRCVGRAIVALARAVPTAQLLGAA